LDQSFWRWKRPRSPVGLVSRQDAENQNCFPLDAKTYPPLADAEAIFRRIDVGEASNIAKIRRGESRHTFDDALPDGAVETVEVRVSNPRPDNLPFSQDAA
jgi:hypothetical protein